MELAAAAALLLSRRAGGGAAGSAAEVAGAELLPDAVDVLLQQH
jgi:hypothetical protein